MLFELGLCNAPEGPCCTWHHRHTSDPRLSCCQCPCFLHTSNASDGLMSCLRKQHNKQPLVGQHAALGPMRFRNLDCAGRYLDWQRALCCWIIPYIFGADAIVTMSLRLHLDCILHSPSTTVPVSISLSWKRMPAIRALMLVSCLMKQAPARGC